MSKKKKIVASMLCIILFIPVFMIGSLVYQHYHTRDGISVIGYHGVVSDKEKEEKYASNKYYISESQLKRHIQYLYDNDYETLTMDEVYDYYYGDREVKKNAVALTFDDGFKNFNTVVKPMLEEYGMTGTCFVIGKNLTGNHPLSLKLSDIHNTSNVYYYSHSYNLHRKAKGFDRKIIQDLTLDEINEDFQKNPIDSTYFAFPYGRTRDGIESVLKENNVKLAFSYNQFRHLTREDDCYDLPRYMFVDIMPDVYFRWIVE